MKLGTAQVIRANSRQLPLANNSVDLVVTSPPYFALRSYQDGGQHYAGQIGDEPTPAAFVASLLEVTAECVRVLKPSGSLWVNLGDKYAGSDGGGGFSASPVSGADTAKSTLAGFTSPDVKGRRMQEHARTKPQTDVRAKSLIGIPWRYALACIDDLGLILRAEVIWSKPNGLPESVTDRVRRSHEQWFHFTLSPRYFSAVDEIREPQTGEFLSSGVKNPRHRYGGLMPSEATGRTSTVVGAADEGEFNRRGDWKPSVNPLGKLPGSVWTIPTEPLRVPDHLGVDHFAAFPTEWPKRIIQGWSPAGVCVACGEGRRPISSSSTVFDKARDQAHATEIAQRGAAHSVMSGGTAKSTLNGTTTHTITGYACACPHPTSDTTPAVILDPFGGTGTTALVAKALGRHGISVDMSADYCRLAEWRTHDRDQLAKVLGVAKAEQQPADQAGLFDLDGGAA